MKILGERFKRALRELAPRPAYRVRSYEHQLYAALVQAGDCAYDVGANAGEVATLLSALTGSRGRVYAFEPVWPTYERLCRRLAARRSDSAPAFPVPMGLGAEEGEVTFTMPKGESEMASMAPADAWQRQTGLGAPDQRGGRITTMARFAALTGAPLPQFLKIDVEGGELLVLKGARPLFQSGMRPAMLMELFAPWERAFGYGPMEPLAFLQEYGYEFLFACPDGLVPHAPTPGKPLPDGYEGGYNVIALHASHHAPRRAALAPLLRERRPALKPMLAPPVPNRVE